MNKKKIIILVIILLIIISILMLTSTKKEELREKDIRDYAKIYIPEHTIKCLKEKKYPVDNPTIEQKEECTSIAKAKFDEVVILNSEDE